MTSYSHTLSPVAAGRAQLGRLLWNIIYLSGKTPWDTGLTPPEVRAVVESGQVRPGRALDLGCGTGTNVLYLAQRGFEVIGIDLSSRAAAQAQRKIRRANLEQNARVYVGNVTRLDSLPIDGLFDLVLDIGCLHVIDASARQDYAKGVIKRIGPGGFYMLYAFTPCVQYGWHIGINSQEVKALFSAALILRQASRAPSGSDSDLEAAWYTFKSALRGEKDNA